MASWRGLGRGLTAASQALSGLPGVLAEIKRQEKADKRALLSETQNLYGEIDKRIMSGEQVEDGLASLDNILGALDIDPGSNEGKEHRDQFKERWNTKRANLIKGIHEDEKIGLASSVTQPEAQSVRSGTTARLERLGVTGFGDLPMRPGGPDLQPSSLGRGYSLDEAVSGRRGGPTEGEKEAAGELGVVTEGISPEDEKWGEEYVKGLQEIQSSPWASEQRGRYPTFVKDKERIAQQDKTALDKRIQEQIQMAEAVAPVNLRLRMEELYARAMDPLVGEFLTLNGVPMPKSMYEALLQSASGPAEARQLQALKGYMTAEQAEELLSANAAGRLNEVIKATDMQTWTDPTNPALQDSRADDIATGFINALQQSIMENGRAATNALTGKSLTSTAQSLGLDPTLSEERTIQVLQEEVYTILYRQQAVSTVNEILKNRGIYQQQLINTLGMDPEKARIRAIKAAHNMFYSLDRSTQEYLEALENSGLAPWEEWIEETAPGIPPEDLGIRSFSEGGLGPKRTGGMVGPGEDTRLYIRPGTYSPAEGRMGDVFYASDEEYREKAKDHRPGSLILPPPESEDEQVERLRMFMFKDYEPGKKRSSMFWGIGWYEWNDQQVSIAKKWLTDNGYSVSPYKNNRGVMMDFAVANGGRRFGQVFALEHKRDTWLIVLPKIEELAQELEGQGWILQDGQGRSVSAGMLAAARRSPVMAGMLRVPHAALEMSSHILGTNRRWLSPDKTEIVTHQQLVQRARDLLTGQGFQDNQNARWESLGMGGG